jgi:hypothetical protein
MLHRLAALAVTCATFPASTHEPAILSAAVLGILIAAGATGCSHHSSAGGAGSAASSLATSPQVRAAEAKLKTCIANGDPLSSAGRHSIITCALPAAASPTARAKAQKCLENAFSSHGFGLTHADRQAILTTGAACLGVK